VDDSDQACLNAEPGILVGEFAVGIMEDRLIAQPVDCFASAGGGVCLGPLRLADSLAAGARYDRLAAMGPA
jgi:hypothetical protein